jgi:hypothetical protein
MDHDQAPRWDAAPEDDSSEYIGVTEKKPRSNFIHRWMNREALTSEDDSSDEETDDSKKKKRFRSLFSRLFPKIAETDKEKPMERTESINLGLFTELTPRDSSEERSSEKPHNTEETKPQQSGEQDQMEYSSETVQNFSNEDEGLLKIEHEPTEDIPKFENLEFPSFSVPETPPPLLNEAPRLVPEVPPILQREKANYQHTFESAGISPPLEIPVSERRHGSGAVIAFMAAEFLSRRRDRKLKKEINKLSKEADQQQSIVDKLKTKIQTVTETVKSNEVQQDSIKTIAETPADYQVPERGGYPVSFNVPKQESNRSSKQEYIKADKAPGNLSRPEKNQEEATLDKERQALEQSMANTDIFLKRREKQLEEIRRANESREAAPPNEDERQEKEFERRHEVLDEPSLRPLSQVMPQGSFITPATSIGEVLEEKKKTVSTTQLSSEEKKNSDLKNTIKNHSSQLDLYQQSVQYGVGAAFAIIVFGLLAYIIF